jgi:hypothetical protein
MHEENDAERWAPHGRFSKLKISPKSISTPGKIDRNGMKI